MSKNRFPFSSTNEKHQFTLPYHKFSKMRSSFQNCEHNFFLGFHLFSNFMKMIKKRQKKAKTRLHFWQPIRTMPQQKLAPTFRQQTRDHKCSRILKDVCNFVTIAKIRNKPRQ
jgi:hypothetical protein